MNLIKECRDLSYTVFVTGIVGLIVFSCMYAMYNLASDLEFIHALYIDVILTIIMFTLPILVASIMIDLYNKSEERGLQNFSKVVDK